LEFSIACTLAEEGSPGIDQKCSLQRRFFAVKETTEQAQNSVSSFHLSNKTFCISVVLRVAMADLSPQRVAQN
jgi:hypothetical protein